MDHARAQAWLDHYVRAWKSYDADDIGALFSEDVTYRYYAYAEPVVGRAAVVASWQGESTGATASTRDAPWRTSTTILPETAGADTWSAPD